MFAWVANPVPESVPRSGKKADFPVNFTMAFQPIVNLSVNRIWGYEALVRGAAGEPASSVLSRVQKRDRCRFDRACRVKAIELAAELLPDDGSHVTVNCLPSAICDPAAGIGSTLEACRRVGFDPRRLVFELTENENVPSGAALEEIIGGYRALGFSVALDDFGAGYAGLNVLADLRPGILKLDMNLIRDIDSSPRRRAILRAMVPLARELGATLIAEGVETMGELAVMRDLGIDLAQGYLFARPIVGTRPTVLWPAAEVVELPAYQIAYQAGSHRELGYA